MIDFEQEQLNQNSEWLIVLKTYAELEQAAKFNAKSQPPEEGFTQKFNADYWIPRVTCVDGVATADLSKLHGQLIAHGFLKFQLASRETGVSYQISPLGKQTLEQRLAEETDPGDLSQDQREAA